MNLEQVRKELPTGAVKTIAEKTGYSIGIVWNVLYGRKSPKEAIILKATAEYLAAYKKEVNEAKEALNAVLNPV